MFLIHDLYRIPDNKPPTVYSLLNAIVNYGEEYISTAIKIFDAMEKICIGGVIALILVSAFLISNTIKLAIFARKTEIEIMRLVGASNVAIKTPFLIEG